MVKGQSPKNLMCQKYSFCMNWNGQIILYKICWNIRKNNGAIKLVTRFIFYFRNRHTVIYLTGSMINIQILRHVVVSWSPILRLNVIRTWSLTRILELQLVHLFIYSLLLVNFNTERKLNVVFSFENRNNFRCNVERDCSRKWSGIDISSGLWHLIIVRDEIMIMMTVFR